MSLKSFLKSIINIWPLYRQGERQSEYLQTLIAQNTRLLHYRFLELCPDGVLKINTEKGVLSFYLPLFPLNITTIDIIRNFDFADKELLEKVKKYIPANGVVADVGANIGNHTLYFAFCLPTAKIYSFEPQKVMFDILRKNCELNDLQDKVELYKCCLGDKEAFAALDYIDIRNAGGTAFSLSEEPTDYKMISLDSLSLDRLDFMKIDVEGHELEVLMGASETIRRCQPVIWCEALTKEHRNKLYRFLKERGYSMSALDSINFLFLKK